MSATTVYENEDLPFENIPKDMLITTDGREVVPTDAGMTIALDLLDDVDGKPIGVTRRVVGPWVIGDPVD